MQFLNALQIDQAHNPTGTGVAPPPPQKKKNYSRKFKITLKIQCMSLITSGLMGVSSRNSSRRRAAVPRGRGDNARTTFGRPTLNNFGGPQKRPNFVTISDNFRL